MSNLATLNAAIAVVDSQGRPTKAFQQQYQTTINELRSQVAGLTEVVNQIAVIVGLTTDLDAAVTAAEAAAASAQASADGANSVASLTNSGVTGLTLTATDAGADATITVSAHTRLYGDGTSLAIAGPTNLTGLAYSTGYYVYYDDPTRADTTPAFLTTTSETTAAQTGDRHLVGFVTTPAALAPPEDGQTVRPPGLGNLQEQ